MAQDITFSMRLPKELKKDLESLNPENVSEEIRSILTIAVQQRIKFYDYMLHCNICLKKYPFDFIFVTRFSSSFDDKCYLSYCNNCLTKKDALQDSNPEIALKLKLIEQDKELYHKEMLEEHGERCRELINNPYWWRYKNDKENKFKILKLLLERFPNDYQIEKGKFIILCPKETFEMHHSSTYDFLIRFNEGSVL